jgi:hypothetical protein
MVRVEECLRQSFPRDLARLSGDGLRVIVMYLYLTMMFMLGCCFNEDPQSAWVQERVKAVTLPPGTPVTWSGGTSTSSPMVQNWICPWFRMYR